MISHSFLRAVSSCPPRMKASIRYIIPMLIVLDLSTASAAITIEGTRVIHDAGRGKDVTVKTHNNGEQPALVQVWIDDGQRDARPENVRAAYQLTPVEPRLVHPQQSQAYRLTFAPRPGGSSIPTDHESVYYFNLLDIPPKPEGAHDSNILQFAVRTRIKVFHRPAGLKGDPRLAASALAWSSGVGRTLDVHNPTPYHVTISHLALDDGTSISADMIAPGEMKRLPIPAAASPPTTVRFQWIDDYGAVREQQAAVIGSTP